MEDVETIIKFVLVLVGVGLGFCLTVLREKINVNRDRQTDLIYLSIHLGYVLDLFICHCADVVSDKGHEDLNNGSLSPSVDLIPFKPHKVDVNYKSLPADLLLSIFRLPAKIEIARNNISEVWWHADPPENTLLFDTRIGEYATLGLEVLELKKMLYTLSGVSNKPNLDHKHFTLFKDGVIEVKQRQEESAHQSRKAMHAMRNMNKNV